MSFSERECDAMDAHRDRCKEDERETRCSLSVNTGILIGCIRDAGHDGLCRTRGGAAGVGVRFSWTRSK